MVHADQQGVHFVFAHLNTVNIRFARISYYRVHTVSIVYIYIYIYNIRYRFEIIYT